MLFSVFSLIASINSGKFCENKQSSFFLIIPAFSKAISFKEFPRIFVCSKLIFVIAAMSELIKFVASIRPPNPVSITIKSGFFSLKNSRQMKKVISKKLSGWGFSFFELYFFIFSKAI